jgi:hypothetical protein
MSGSLDDKVALVLSPSDYLFVVIGAEGVGESRLYRSPFVSPKDVADALRRIADVLEAVASE